MLRRESTILLFLTVVLVAGCRPAATPFECTDAIGCVKIAPDEPVKIGVLQALTGELAPQGLQLSKCIQLAVDDRDGVLLDHLLELHSADSRCSREGGTTAVLQLTADPQIVGIVGPTCSSAAASAMVKVAEAGLVMISGSSSSLSLTSVGGEPGPDWRPGFLRTAQNDAVVGRAAATFAFQVLGVRKAATINDGDPYTRGLTDTFAQGFTEFGGDVVLATAVNKGDTDMRPVLNAVTASGAELLFFPVFQPEGEYIILQASAVEGMESTTLMSAEGLYYDTFVETIGEAGVGVHFIAPVMLEGPAYEDFIARYEAQFNERPTKAPYHAHMYDAANLLLDAVEAVAVQDGDGTLHIGRQALRDTLYATSGKQGLTGSLACDDYGDCGVARFKVVRLDDPAAGFEGLAANVVYAYPPEE
jgi:branched-chain amino acid transport system substrate-binding protein